MTCRQAEDMEERMGRSASLSQYDSRPAYNSAALAINLTPSDSRLTPEFPEGNFLKVRIIYNNIPLHLA